MPAPVRSQEWKVLNAQSGFQTARRSGWRSAGNSPRSPRPWLVPRCAGARFPVARSVRELRGLVLHLRMWTVCASKHTAPIYAVACQCSSERVSQVGCGQAQRYQRQKTTQILGTENWPWLRRPRCMSCRSGDMPTELTNAASAAAASGRAGILNNK